MSQRTTETKRINTQPNAVVRDKQYYFNTLDIEHDLLKKAADIAERMMVAFMRENKVEVSIDPEDIANRIAEKLGKRVYHPGSYPTSDPGSNPGSFDYDDGPVVLKTDRIEVKGKVGKESKTGDSISDNLDALEGLNI
jgi:hypothetical protein